MRCPRDARVLRIAIMSGRAPPRTSAPRCVRAAPLTPKKNPERRETRQPPIIAFIVHKFFLAPYFLFASEQAKAPRALFSTPAVLHFSGSANLVVYIMPLGAWVGHAHMLSFIIPGAAAEFMVRGGFYYMRNFLAIGRGSKRPRDYLCNENEDSVVR